MIPDELRIVAGAAIAGVTAVAGGAATRYLISRDEVESEKKIETTTTETTSTVDGEVYITKTSDDEYITTFTEGKYVTKSTTGDIEYITVTGDANVTKTTINGEEYEYITTITEDTSENATYITKSTSGKGFSIFTTSDADYQITRIAYIKDTVKHIVPQEATEWVSGGVKYTYMKCPQPEIVEAVTSVQHSLVTQRKKTIHDDFV